MDMLPVPIPKSEISLLPRVGPLDLFDALLADARCPNSKSARLNDVRAVAAFLNQEPAAACRLFIAGGRSQANAIAMAYRASAQTLGRSAATTNRRLATLRRIVRLARRFDLLEWDLDCDDLPAAKSRDTRGPSAAQFTALWDFCVKCGDNPTARRNRALIRLMHDSALRKNEVLSLDLADLDLSGERARIIGKGSREKSWVTLSPLCVRLLREWLEARGPGPGPAVFTSHIRNDAVFIAKLNGDITALRAARRTWEQVADAMNANERQTRTGMSWTGRRVQQHVAACRNAQPYSRLAAREVNRLLIWMSAECGIDRHVKPHGLRHRAITAALELTNGNIRNVQLFARHSRPETTCLYADNLADVGGDIARQLGAD